MTNTNPIFDKSNDDYKFTRNKIRKEIIPGLEAINPKVINALIKLGNIAKIKNNLFFIFSINTNGVNYSGFEASVDSTTSSSVSFSE